MSNDTPAETAPLQRDGSSGIHRRGILAAGAATALGASLGLSAGATAAQDDTGDYPGLSIAALTGAQQTEEIDTEATGGAVVSANEERSELEYAVLVHAIEDVTQAHIHLGPAGEDGPVAVWLYPGPDATEPGLEEGRFDGILATGTITEEHLTEEVDGQTMDALFAQIASGDTYVNVHTEANPAGEIRGQLLSATDVADAVTDDDTDDDTGQDDTDTDDEQGDDVTDDDASGDDATDNESVGDDAGNESSGNESSGDDGYGG
ncbi:nicotinate-mononucleotide:5,6-dimethylbenzimidazole phosphoribosyltransferase CobT [Halovivax ruber XH-70]|uniref:Nicotinate-mononucleotide:5, 6-dimethylbenzimidazole phosphoribosyltransferase CobT n=1 Tax=Halovivax ruber (strain DSM 18193 / JCM 13892 / XH-70) TaxID=797302 RepID=L0I8I3_HALRX|nr:CHRD domain-containing protein [Halovivax ruber]AGB15014.1 nicotinate-mononucleotide:5,6-dimethylbenzimidazole phosphoribosyltransferase CobT [Halovivax ruber XH-70]